MTPKLELAKLTSEGEVTLYTVPYKDVEILLSSTPEAIDILDRPECIGVDFQAKLSKSITRTLAASYTLGLGSHAINMETGPMDVLYLLRGGLNFDLHRSLTEVVGRAPEVTFLSSQRVEDVNSADGFEIGEASYEKWSIQDQSLLCIGDISATGTTLEHALGRALSAYAREGKRPRRLLIVTIGTSRLIPRLANMQAELRRAWSPSFEGITVLYLDGIFTLYERNAALSKTHLSFTDFFRKEAPRSIEFEEKNLANPVCFLERCAIYDGGSRSFEPATYLRNLFSYWQRLFQERQELDIRRLLMLKSDLLDHELPFFDWVGKRYWWRNTAESELRRIHEQGRDALGNLLSRSLADVCEERMAQLPKVEETKEMRIIDKLAWINLDNRRILSTRSKGKDTYYIPGGKREADESDHDALIREIREELTVELLRDSLQHIGTFEAQAHGHNEGVIVRMTCYSGKYNGELAPSSEIDEMVWFEHKDRDRSSPVDKIIFDWLRDQDLID